MNLNQQKALDIALEGHNLLLLGSAGTGKSFVIKEIHSKLQEIGKTVQITCSTGIACNVYQGKACTIHQFTGISDGRYGPEEIVKVIKNNRKYDYVVDSILKTDTLIIDECSMLSAKVFQTIEAVCNIKEQSLVFGGIQIIMCGDFFQLPPVSNIPYGDDGKYCFEYMNFNIYFPHRVVLSQIVRQSQHDLIQLITEVYDGNISPESEDLISYLKRPLQYGSTTFKLFSRNDLVDDYNRRCILQFPGEKYQYKSKDQGQISSLSHIQAPRTLWLKVGCPVILLRNLSEMLVNGLQGYVDKIVDGSDPIIKFPSLNLTTKITKVKFTVYSQRSNSDIASREQYPLKLAFGLTIHRAQGMTLDRAEVDCRDIFRSGQLGVALSRVKTLAGLRVLNYHPRYILPPPQTVREFMNETSSPTSTNLSCCNISSIPHSALEQYQESEPENTDQLYGSIDHSCGNDIEDIYTENLDETFDDEFDSVIKSIASEEDKAINFEIPENFSIDNILQSMKFNKEVTPAHISINNIITKIEKCKLITFVKKLFLKFSIFADKLIGKTTDFGRKPEKNIVQFYRLVHDFSTGAEYNLSCLLLFENEDFTANHQIVCYNILEPVRQFFLKQKVQLLQSGKSTMTKRYVTDSSRPRIRYVAGYCLASLRKKYTKMQRTHICNTTVQGQDMYNEAKWVVFTLNILKEDEHYLKEHSEEPDSLIDIERRQYTSHGLTNVNDSLFKFFVSLTERCLTHLVHENLMKFGKNLYNRCFELIKEDDNIYEQFTKVVVSSYSNQPLEEFDEGIEVHFSLLQNIVYISTATHKIYQELVQKYLMVLLSQFRKDLKSAISVEKTMAHRKQIKVAKRKKGISEQSAESVSSPKKTRKTVKAKQLSDCTVIQSDSDTSNQPIASGVPNAGTIQDPQPGPSCHSQSDTDLDTLSELCQSCFKDRNDEWIQCDSCDSWYHRKCAGLNTKLKWKKFSKEGVSWFCKTCQ